MTYIRTTPEEFRAALTNAEFHEEILVRDCISETDWKTGSSFWKMVHADGRVTDGGEILELNRPRRIVLKWKNEFRPELAEEGYARCAIEIEPQDKAVKLTILHTIERANSKLIVAVSGGWPRILSNLKSLLETGELVLVEKPAAA